MITTPSATPSVPATIPLLPWPAVAMISMLTLGAALHTYPQLLAPAATYLRLASIALR